MQDLSTAMASALAMRSPSSTRTIARKRALLFEVYDSDYLPGEDELFNPADAIALWARAGVTWLGNEYRRQVLSVSGITRFMTGQYNSCSLTLSNEAFYMSAFVVSHEIEGMRLVVRYIDADASATLADSVILFVGRLAPPTSLDAEECSLDVLQEIASVDFDIPRRTFSPFDPLGRSPNDPLYEGFNFQTQQGVFQFATTVTKRFLFFFTKKKTKLETQQWSSEIGVTQDQILPLIFGRCQMELLPVYWADIGFYIIGLFVGAGHKVTSITDVQVQSTGYQFSPLWKTLIAGGTHTHLGDPGGTGTNAAPDTIENNFRTNTSPLSRTAYMGLAIFGPEGVDQNFANQGEDAVPTVTAILRGEVDLPGEDGVFDQRGFSDNPAYISRLILTDADIMGLDSRLIDDAELVKTAADCFEILKDDTNGEMLVLPGADAVAQQAGLLTRYNSSGVLTTTYWKHAISGSNPDPWTTPRLDSLVIPIDGGGDCPVGFHPDPFTGDCVADSPFPKVVPRVTYLRRRYTFNAPLTNKTKASDFLFNTVFPSARLYMLIGANGKLKIKTEKPADSSYLLSDVAAGATSLPLNDVEPWRASTRGLVLVGVNLTTSETRQVTGAAYSTAGNSITLSVSAGSATVAASGAALSGGSSSTPASGTVTVSDPGTPGDSVTILIDGVAISYVVSSDDSAGTVAAMLSAKINADWGLKTYIRSTWDPAAPTVLHIIAKVGNLTLASGLTNAHKASLDDPLVAPSLSPASSGTLRAGKYTIAFAYVSGTGGTTLPSPVAEITVDGTQRVSVASLGTLPAGVAAVNWYMSKAENDDHMAFLTTNSGGAFFINALPLFDALDAPIGNSSGHETIRVMASFTEQNILTGKFRWPLGDQASKINQVIIKYRDAAAGFAERELRVNDYAHQARVKKVNSVEINGAGVDNYNQAVRLANARLAKEREGGFFVEWSTDEGGLPFEEGDVVCATEVSAGFVNLPLRIESLTIDDDVNVSFRGRLYSTVMYSDQAGKHPVLLPTTLKFFNNAPPPVTNLALTEVGGYSPDLSFITGIQVDFDFATWLGVQKGHVFIKGGAGVTSEPDDSTYREVENAVPDANNHGKIEIRALPRGKYWIKVVAESLFGLKPATGNPVASIELSPPLHTQIKIFDNVPPQESIYRLGLTIGVARAAGSGAWFGTALFRDRGYGHEMIAPSMVREATMGVSTNNGINWLGDGSGGSYAIAYLQLASGSLTAGTVSSGDIAAGRNTFFWGREKIGFLKATDLGSGLWKLENPVRGLGHTAIFQGTHTAAENVILLDENAYFIPIDKIDVPKTLEFKARTWGEDLSAATTVSFTTRGDSIRPYFPTEDDGVPDGAGDWNLSLTSQARPEEQPETFTARVRRTSDGVLMRDIPLSPSIVSMAAMFTGLGNVDIQKNNLYPTGDPSEGFSRSIQVIHGPGAVIDFVASIENFSLNLVLHFIPADLDPWDNLLGSVAGIQVQSGDLTHDPLILVSGFAGEAIAPSPDRLKSPAKIRCAFVGTEVRFYVDWSGPNTKPIAISAVPPTFPLRLRAHVQSGAKMENIIIGGLSQPQTIYSGRQQKFDNEANGGPADTLLNDITVEMWQNSPLNEIQQKGFSTIPKRFNY